MERVLIVAALNNHRHLVLGAWGCGVFGNSTMEIALMWRKFLIDGKFKNTFETITFAITDEKFVNIFKNVFDPAASLDDLLLEPRNPDRGRGRGREGKKSEQEQER